MAGAKTRCSTAPGQPGETALERWDSQPKPGRAGSGAVAGGGGRCGLLADTFGWTITATASNRANAQVSTTSLVFSIGDPALKAPTISRIASIHLKERSI